LKKVALVFPSFDVGGMETQMVEVVNRLSSQFNFYIISLIDAFACKSRINQSSAISYFTLNKKSDHFQVSCFKLFIIFKKIKPDVVVTFNFGAIEGILAAKLCRVANIVHFEHGFHSTEVKKRKARRIWLRRILFILADQVVIVSTGLFDLAKKEWWVPENKIKKLFNGVDNTKYSRLNHNNLKSIYGFSDDSILIGSVASLTPIKNQSRLIDIFNFISKQEPKVFLVIAGEGPEKANLLEMIRSSKLDKRVILMGRVDNTPEVYRLFDIFTIMSLSEQTPISILEAMASALPIVSTDVGDIKQMVAEENKKYIFRASDDRQAIEAFQELIQNSELRARIGQANRQRVVQCYSLSSTVQAYRNLFEGVYN